MISDKIIQDNPIKDYMDAEGLVPEKESSGKLIYRCPMPNHPNDNEASFTLYVDTPKQNYFCYGCKSGGNIINFRHDYEGIAYATVIQDMCSGIDNDEDEEYYFKLREELEESRLENTDEEELAVISLDISLLFYRHIRRYGFHSEEVAFLMEKSKVIDELIIRKDLKSVSKIFNYLDEKGLVERGKYRANIELNNELKEMQANIL